MGWFIGILTVWFVVTLWIFFGIVHNIVDDGDKRSLLCGLICAMFLMFLIGGLVGVSLVCVVDSDTPDAIDVYRGNTDMEIKYTIVNNDTIDRDTTVVWKNNVKK